MKIAILLRTSENRGDHAADVSIALEQKENETLEQLIDRAGLTCQFDHLEIRLLKAKKD